MNKAVFYLAIAFILSCNNTTTEKETKTTDSTSQHNKKDTALHQDVNDADFANYYIIVVDTNSNYYSIKDYMIKLSKLTKMEIDSMGRTYVKSKNLIALTETDDEIYQNQYAPRRFPSQFLSIEYLDYYKENDAEKTMAVVAGIYETLHEADSATKQLQHFNKEVYSIKSRVFIGCMH